jgi:hypothetical protein
MKKNKAEEVAAGLFNRLNEAEALDPSSITVAMIARELAACLEEHGYSIVELKASADPTEHACPHCHTVNPRQGFRSVVAEVPGMGKIVIATIYCGECRLILGTQILEMQTMAIKAQEAGLDPSGAMSKGGLHIPGRGGFRS